MTNKQTRGMAVRRDIATWYTPEEKRPPENETVVITFNGPRRIHALGCGAYCEDEGWLIDGMNKTDSDKMTVEAWCDLEPYMMGGGKISKCRSCGADIIWIKMASGKMMPCDARPIRYFPNFISGKLTLVTPDGKIARGDADPVSGERVGYQSHFATCPYAEQHRRREK